jgi:hypothetical protein
MVFPPTPRERSESKSVFTRLHHRDMAIRELIRHGVCVEGRSGIDVRTAFDDDDVRARLCKMG